MSVLTLNTMSYHACQPDVQCHPPQSARGLPSKVHIVKFSLILALITAAIPCALTLPFGAPKDWAIPPELTGSELYTTLLRAGAVSNSNIALYSDEPLLQSLGRSKDSLALINIEALLTRVIWQQHPQHAIDIAFQVFKQPGRPQSSSTDTPTADSEQPTASENGTWSGFPAHPSLKHTLDFLMEAPQAINTSFVHMNDLSHRQTWLAIAQIRAIARGNAACVPPGILPAAAAAAAIAAMDNPDAAAIPQYSCTLAEELQLLRWLIAQLPKRFALPLVRRMSVAALLMRRAERQIPFTNAEQRQIMMLFLQLYSSHRTAAMRKAVVEFFHISKAGGTSMCSLSQKNGCTTWDAGEKRNCLVYEFDDLPHWVSRKAHTELQPNKTMGGWFINFENERNQVFCARRRHFMLMKGWDMYAHEYTLVGGRVSPRGVQLCTDMVTMMQIRHPYTRLVSHLRWIYGLYHERQVDIQLYWPNTTSSHWQYMAPAVVDNYYTRSLLGEGIYHLPGGEITSSHGVMAQLLVAQYDVLLVLEQSASRRLGLGMGLGWHHVEQEEKQRSADDLMARVHAKKQAEAAAAAEALAVSSTSTTTSSTTTTTTSAELAIASSTDDGTEGAATATTTTTSTTVATATATATSIGVGRKLLVTDSSDMLTHQLQAAQPNSGPGRAAADEVNLGQASQAYSSLEHQPTSGSAAAAPHVLADKTQSLIKAATSQGVPKDLGLLLSMNQVDLHLYQTASWLARFDAAVLETVKLALGDDAYAGLDPVGNGVKARARMEARQRKVAAERHQAKQAMLRSRKQSRWPPFPPTPVQAVAVDDPSTCGFAGF